MEEIEVKFLNINTTEIENKLNKLGAKKIFEKLYRRKVFDYPDLRLDKNNSWIRLRDERDKITLTYKQRQGVNSTSSGDTSMEEIEIIVDNFEITAEFLEKLGLKVKFYEENKRIRYQLDSIFFDIDLWPLLNPYLEIESDEWKNIDKAIDLLKLNKDEKKIFSTHQIYKLNGIDENSFSSLTFEAQIKK